MQDKKLVFLGRRQPAWEAFEVDQQPSADDLLVEATASMVNYGTLVAIYTGTHINIDNPDVAWPKYPHSPSGDVVGVIRAVGPDASGFALGDRVRFAGPYCKWHRVSASNPHLLKVPAGVTDTQAVTASHSTISLNGIRLAGTAIGDMVLVLGQGVIGQYALQYARIAGASVVIVVDPIPERLAISRQCGADVIVNPTTEDTLDAVMRATDGAGASVVIEATGVPTLVPVALKAAAPAGRVVLLGSSRGTVEIDPYNDIHRKGVVVYGAHAQTAPKVANASNPWTTDNNTLAAWAHVSAGRLHLEQLVSHVLPASESLDLFDRLADHREQYLGVVLDWSR